MSKRKTNDALMAYLEDRFTYDGKSNSASERPDFKPILARDYLLVPEQQYRETPSLLCQILDVKLPKFLVSAFHVFKRKWAADSYYLLDFDDVDSFRNGLLLFQPIERAFNRSQLCFLKANREYSLFLRLLDPGLRGITLFDACLPLINEIDCASIGKTVDEVLSVLQSKLSVNGRLLTFGDIEGNRIVCKGNIRPYKRCLNFHAAVARRFALKQGWITHDVYSTFKWSQAFNKDDRIISHIDEIKTSSEAVDDENLENQFHDNILPTESVNNRVLVEDEETDVMRHHRQQNEKEKLLEFLRYQELDDLIQQYHESNGSIIEIWIQRTKDYWECLLDGFIGIHLYNILHPPVHFRAPAELKEDDSEFILSWCNIEFPFFDSEGKEDPDVPVENDMLLTKINKNVLDRFSDGKYLPIIISASHDMDTTSFLRDFGMQNVPEHLKCPEIVKAGQCGRILSFDFSLRVEVSLWDNNVFTFFQSLMVYHLCRMFRYRCVDGINFKSNFRPRSPITWGSMLAQASPGTPFYRWLSMCRNYRVDEMMDEYMRLTNIAFRGDCDVPPVFLLKGVERIANIRNNNIAGPDGTDLTMLSLLLERLAGRHNPICISTGIDDRGILETQKTTIGVDKAQEVGVLQLHQDVDKTNRLGLDDNLKEYESARFITERSLFLKAMNSNSDNQISKVMSLLDLPAEIIRLIALNLSTDFSDLMEFQKASPTIRAVTSDVSFYYEYFTENHTKDAIFYLRHNRDSIPNWRKVQEVLFENTAEYVRFFYGFPGAMFQRGIDKEVDIAESRLGRTGYILGKIFLKFALNLPCSKTPVTFELVQKKLSELRAERQSLSKTYEWRLFEDIMLSRFQEYLRHGSLGIKNLGDLNPWLMMLDYAFENGYHLFQQAIMKHMVDEIVISILRGCINVDQGLERLKWLIPQVENVERIGYPAFWFFKMDSKTLSARTRLCEFLLKEIVGKRRKNYACFFRGLIQEWMEALSEIVTNEEYRQDQLDALKVFLRWRFVIPNGSWRLTDSNSYQLVCLVDESLRSIIYPKGFYMKYLCWREMERLLTYGCSKNFRNACEKYLYSSDLVCHDNELVVEARKACRLHAKKQTEDV
ncbi:hypothetical protein MP638_000906 [Amoeboaphelidium occidentale]|nr:hypothetical protein MP638_000906 [Amoeboaphelidium occidentale]